MPPKTHIEPSIPITTGSRYNKVATLRAIIAQLDSGDLREPALLTEQMLSNPRLRGVNETRMAGLQAAAIRWEPARKNAAARKAAAAIEEDWPLIASDATRAQLHQWGLNLGVGLAQKRWYRSESSGRLIPWVQVYHPTWAYWDWASQCYQIHTHDTGLVSVPSPSLTAQRPRGLGVWVVHEPFGQNSWRWGLIHAAWYAWLGHQWADRDQSRASEKLGVGIVKAFFPTSADAKKQRKFLDGLKTMGSEGLVPCEDMSETGGGKFDVVPMEFSGSGYEMIQRTKDSKAVDLAVLYLGHNLTTEAKGGSYAAANIGELIRADIRARDAANERATYYPQVIADWAEANFGDPELAPIPIYETDPPAINEAAARTLQQLGQALLGMARFPEIDRAAILSRFRVPLVQASPKAEVPAEAPAVAPGAAVSAPDAAAPPASNATAPPQDAAAADATLAITPTDLASIVTVDEGRQSVGLDPVGGDIGSKWIREHGAQLAATLPAANPEPSAEPAPADQTQPDPQVP